MIRVPFTLRGASASLLGLAATQAVAFVVEFAVARRLGASGLGVLAVGTGLAATFGATIVTAFASAASAQVARSHELGISAAVGGHLRLAVRLALIAAGAVAAALFVVADPLAAALTGASPGAAAVIRLFAVALPFQAAGGVGVGVALALGRPRTEVAYRWTDAAVRALTVPALLVFGADVTAVATIHVFAAIASLPVGLLPAFSAAGPAEGSVRHELSDVLSLAGWQTVATGAWLSARRLDVLIVSALLGPQAAGAYRLATVLSSVGGMVMLALQPVFFPVAARRFAVGGAAGLGDHYRRVRRFAMIASAPVAAALIVAHDRTLQLFGAPFVVAGTGLVILAASQQLLAVTGHTTTVVQIAGYPRRAALSVIAGVCTQMAGLLTLAPRFGIAGAATALSLGLLVTVVLQIEALRRAGVAVIDPQWSRGVVLVGLLFAAAFVADAATRASLLLGVLLYVVAVAAFAAAALRQVIPPEERALLAGFVGSRRSGPVST